MIFLLITFLAWAILSIGMLGIDWGYATWSQTRLHTAAQSLALHSLSDHSNQRLDETIIRETMGFNSSTIVDRTFPDPTTTHVQVSRGIEMPLKSLSIHNYFDQQFPGVSTELQYGVVSSATAQLHPARQVGMPHTGQLAIPGVLPCVLEKKSWESLTEKHSVAATINSFGEILIHGRKVGQFSQIVTYIGQEVHDPKPLPKTQVSLEGYIPIFQRIGKHDRVVGFGYAQIQGTSHHVSISKHVTRTGSQNASTQLTGDISELSQEELVQIFAMNQTLKGAVLAPSLM